MGIGDAEGIIEVIERGIDMFDCVLPTRTARTGSALTWEGRLNLRNARFARDPDPLDEGCTCPACARFSRAYIRHLINQEELLGLRLLTLHNLHFVLDVTAQARAAIEAGELASGPLIFFVANAAVMWFLLIRPQRQRQAAHRQLVAALAPDDEVVTAGGMFGTVRSITDDHVMLEIAPEMQVRIAKEAVTGVLRKDEESASETEVRG